MNKWRLANRNEIELDAPRIQLDEGSIMGWYEVLDKVKNELQFKIKESSMFEITQFKEINKSALVATFTLKIAKWGDFCIREMAYFKTHDKRWISFPSRQYESEGKKKYFQYCLFEKPEMTEAFKNKVLDSIDEYIKKNPSSQKQPDLFEDNEPGPPPF
jgi:hypothetical protein